jgi:hypothetical protein
MNGRQQDDKNNDMGDLRRVYQTSPKQVYQGLTGDQGDDYDDFITVVLVFVKQEKS